MDYLSASFSNGSRGWLQRPARGPALRYPERTDVAELSLVIKLWGTVNGKLLSNQAVSYDEYEEDNSDSEQLSGADAGLNSHLYSLKEINYFFG